jgi:hypothetical protein
MTACFNFEEWLLCKLALKNPTLLYYLEKGTDVECNINYFKLVNIRALMAD